MQNIFRQLDANAPSHMNAFDLSQRHIMSTKVGLKNVVCAIDCMPKDYFEIDNLNLVRSMPINTAAFSRMKMTFEAVFVPYQQLWHGWNQFYLQTEERMSVGDSFDHTKLPSMKAMLILPILHDCALYDSLKKTLTSYVSRYPRLLDKIATDHNLSVSDDILNQVWFAERLIFDNISDCLDEMGLSRGWSILRALDQLGYGSFYAIYQGAIHDVYMNLFEDGDLIDVNQDGSINIAQTVINFNNEFQRFMPYLFLMQDEEELTFDLAEFLAAGYDYFDFVKQWAAFYDFTFGDSVVVDSVGSSWNIFRGLAYQKAYQDFTMNKRQEAYDPTFFNVDSYDAVSDYSLIAKIFTFRYEAWDYDLYTGVFNSPQTGDVSILNNNVSLLFKPTYTTAPGNYDLRLPSNMQVNREYEVGIGSSATPTDRAVAGTFVTRPAVSVYDIKRAEFLQRWKENHLRAGNKLQNQAIGQWNTRFKYLSDEYSEFISSWDMPINIDEVINTADNQGDISGKGIGTSNGSFKFRTDDAGVLLIMVSVKPRAEYDALMIDKANTNLEIGDFPSPFFDNLGFESVPMYLLSQNTLPRNRVGSLGYTVRYAPYKTAVDKVHGNLMSFGFNETNGSGSLSIWSTPRRDIESIEDLSDISQMFYVNPSVVDSIFGFDADGSLETDHFILNANVICKVVRNLSVSGQLMFGL